MLQTLLPILLSLAALHAAGIAKEEPASVPFAPRSAPGGTTLFTELPSARTGIITTNRYDDPRMWAELHREYHVGAIGTGVAVGDYDGDGRPDIYIVSKV
ncbi:MAG TPA: VCBS repeat-containing protein, partial [Opitutaceae bacterium]